MQCKCGEWETEIIKTEGSVYSDSHCNHWITVKEYYQCPFCGKQYVMEYNGLASDLDWEEIKNEDE